VKKILIIDDDSYICGILEKYLNDNGFDATSAFTGKSGTDKISKITYDLVLCDFRLPDSDGFEMLNKIKLKSPQTKVIIITAYADVRLAVKLMKAGAVDYVTKPIQQEEILHILNKTLSGTTSGKGSTIFHEQFIVGESKKIKEVIKLANLVSSTDMSVILQGETGSGKEYIARLIHLKSKRKNNPFIALDCGAIPKELANSELFGHIKGSFTGAIANKTGVFEQANGGTLFLDEVGNLSYDVQVKLLRTLQERVVTRVGDTKNIKVDVRIISATNEDLKKEVINKKFREDLFHRLNEFKIIIPPLRERKEDILIFTDHFISLSNEELQKNVMGLDDEATYLIQQYPWHGNLRELKNVIKRSILLADENTITVDLLPDEIKYYQENEPAEARIERSPTDLKEASWKAEKKLIVNTLAKVNNNKSKAAKILNIDRKTLYNKLKQYDIETNQVPGNN